MSQDSPGEFVAQAKRDLGNPKLRDNYHGAMNYLMQRRASAFADDPYVEQLRDQADAIRREALSQLPELLEQLETQCQANGIQVHWAETADEANQIISGLVQSVNGTLVAKGKSMVSEEVELNHYLEQEGIAAIETDMGEYILQLAGEKPSHIIMPALHKNVQDISDLFQQHIPDFHGSTDVDELIQTGRRQLRQTFKQAQVGVSGVNFAVAETGTLCLVENEGNGRLCTTVPPMHIAITGIEKVIPRLSDLPTLLSLLTRSATGQRITTYINMISSPRKTDEKDGPEQVHLVLLDNGRSHAFADPEFVETLKCIRCGSCMNHCPVYKRVGGHAYGTVYPGPIGQIISPHLLGLEATQDLPIASSLCGACAEVCPVRIPIPNLLINLRNALHRQPGKKHRPDEGSRRKLSEALAWQLWSYTCSTPWIYRLTTRLMASCRGLMPKRMGPWSKVRTLPKPAAKTLDQLVANRAKGDRQ